MVTMAACISACVNVPYIEPTRYSTTQTSSDSLEGAVDHADRSYDAYEAKIVEEWRRQQGLATALIGVGAIAIGAAVGHAHRDVFAALGLGSATAYQLGSWNSNSGRIGIYLEGMKALVCAKAAVQPLRLSREARERIREAQKALIKAINGAATAVARSGPARATTGEDSAAQALQAELQALQNDLDVAQQLLARSASMDQRMDGAGAMLQQKIDDIRTVIDTALHATQADLSSLRTSIQGISAYSTQFNGDVQSAGLAIAKSLAPPGTGSTGTTAAPESKKDEEAADPPGTEISAGQALGVVGAARVRLKAASARLRGTVDRPVDTVSAGLANCGVDATKLSAPLALDEPNLTLKSGQVRTAVIEIKGGTRPIAPVEHVDLPAPGLTASLSPEGGSMIVVADTTTQPGTYRFRARDSAKVSTILTVTVTSDTVVPSATTESGKALCSGLRQMSRPKACFLQSSLGVAVDGRAGKQTCAAFERAVAGKANTTPAGLALLARRSNLTADSSDADFMSKLGARDAESCNSGAVKAPVKQDTGKVADRSAEAQLSADQIRQLASALGQAPVTDINQLREALTQNQRDSKCPNTNGAFTAEEIQRLFKRGKCS